MITRRVADQVPWPESMIKTTSAWGRKNKKLIMKDSVQFLNRKGKNFDWDNDDLDDLEIKKDPSKLIHPDIPAEFPGMELQRDQNTPSRVTVHYPTRTERDPKKEAAAARIAAGLDTPPEDSEPTRGVDDTADTAEDTGDVDQGVDHDSDDDSEYLPDLVNRGNESDSDSDSDSDRNSEDEYEHTDIIAEEVEDTAVDEVEDAPDEDSAGKAAETAVPIPSPVASILRTSRGRVIRKPNNLVPTMTGKSHGKSRDKGVNFPP